MNKKLERLLEEQSNEYLRKLRGTIDVLLALRRQRLYKPDGKQIGYREAC